MKREFSFQITFFGHGKIEISKTEPRTFEFVSVPIEDFITSTGKDSSIR